jgi:hypothetical protein
MVDLAEPSRCPVPGSPSVKNEPEVYIKRIWRIWRIWLASEFDWRVIAICYSLFSIRHSPFNGSILNRFVESILDIDLGDKK